MDTHTGRHHPTNIDGQSAGLRHALERKYLKFFLPVVSGPDLAMMKSSSYPSDDWWRALVQVGIREIAWRVGLDDFEPRPDPTEGIHLPIAAVKVEEELGSGGPLPELQEGLFAGHEVGAFEGP